MTLAKLLGEFVDAIANAMANAPDEYPEWSARTYQSHRTDILDLWSRILPKIKRDLEQAGFIDQKVHEAFKAFDEEGDKARGRQALCDIYNAMPKKLR